MDWQRPCDCFARQSVCSMHDSEGRPARASDVGPLGSSLSRDERARAKSPQGCWPRSGQVPFRSPTLPFWRWPVRTQYTAPSLHVHFDTLGTHPPPSIVMSTRSCEVAVCDLSITRREKKKVSRVDQPPWDENLHVIVEVHARTPRRIGMGLTDGSTVQSFIPVRR